MTEYIEPHHYSREEVEELLKLASSGKFNIFCKIRAQDTNHAKNIIFSIDDIEGISRTETMISLEESINDKKRLMHMIFNNL